MGHQGSGGGSGTGEEGADEGGQGPWCAPCSWGGIDGLGGAADLVGLWLSGQMDQTPGHVGPPAAETATIQDTLLTLTATRAVVPVGSQPGIVTSARVQRASLDLIGLGALVWELATVLERDPDLRVAVWPTVVAWPAGWAPGLRRSQRLRRTQGSQRLLPPHTPAQTPSPPPEQSPRLFSVGSGDGLAGRVPVSLVPDPGWTGVAQVPSGCGDEHPGWMPCTWSAAGWSTTDVLPSLVVRPAEEDETQWQLSLPFFAALEGSMSLTVFDARWGRERYLHERVADVAGTWVAHWSSYA